jgi:hypothetical protein
MITCNIILPNPTQLIMSNLPTLISGAQNTSITDTNPITTTDNNGKVATVAYSVNSDIPPGLDIDSSTGVISGKPTSSGSGTFTITATGTGD